MNIWRRCVSQNQTPGPAPTPIPPWDNSKLVYLNNTQFSRKVVNNEDVSTDFINKWFTDSTYGNTYKRLFTAYKNGNTLGEYISTPGISRLYTYKPNVGGDFQYNENYDDHSIQFTDGNTVAFYCIYFNTNINGISYLGIMDALKRFGFYKNIPGNIPIQPAVKMPVTYFKNGIYRATKELVTPGTPIPTENTLINGFKIGTTSTLYNLQGPSVSSNGRAVYPFKQITRGGRPWSHSSNQNIIFAETGGVQETIPDYIMYNNGRYTPSDFVGLTIPFAPLFTIGQTGTGHKLMGVVIASTNFNIPEINIEF